ncbi:hypothetical protein NE865_02390 [Phthorimaea operculella]|nr:hypothetical protein NE865_02390 [Phthorimaea operculella]
MLPYSRGLIPENSPNFGIMKTETVFGFTPQQEQMFGKDILNTSDPLRWMFPNSSAEKRSLSDKKPTITVPIRTTIKKPKTKKVKSTKTLTKTHSHENKKKKKRTSKKVSKCIIKFQKGGEDGGEEFMGKKRKRLRGGGGSKFKHMKKKYLLPLIIGIVVAKMILLKIALKFLAFISAKGLMMGFFSTVLASLVGLKGMWYHPHESSKRNDDSKTQVEIIQVPTKSEDQHIYYDEHYNKRGDTGSYIPVFPANDILVYDNYNNVLQKKAFVVDRNEIPRYENIVKKRNTTTPIVVAPGP